MLKPGTRYLVITKSGYKKWLTYKEEASKMNVQYYVFERKEILKSEIKLIKHI